MLVAILSLVAVILAKLNSLWFASPYVGAFLLLIWIFLVSFCFGRAFFRKSGYSFLYGFLSWLVLTIVVLSLTYYVYEINSFIVWLWSFLLSLLCLFLIKKKETAFSLRIIDNFKIFYSNKENKRQVYGVVLYLILIVFSFLMLEGGKTYEAVRTPWRFVSSEFFVWYFLSSLCLLVISRFLSKSVLYLLSALHLFLSFSVANVIFPLGYGYDPLIHRATEKYILEHGSIFPKPFYYIGQYVLVVFASIFSGVKHILIDVHLVPLMASLLLPATVGRVGESLKLKGVVVKIVPLFVLLLPFAIFTFTTPQNLGYLLFLVLMFLFLAEADKEKKIVKNKIILAYLMGVSIFLVHPIAGIAALIALVVATVYMLKLKIWIKAGLYTLLALSGVLAFFVLGVVSRFKAGFGFDLAGWSFWQNVWRFFPDLFFKLEFKHLILSLAYAVWQPVVISVLVVFLAVYFVISWKKVKNRFFWLVALILGLNSYLIFSLVDFNFLIDYERGDFSYRFFSLALISLWPLAVFGLYALIKKIFIKNRLTNLAYVFLLMVLAVGLTLSLYMSYPRNDVYEKNRGFNSSVHDFRVAAYLDEITQEPYVVLANQQAGAAALNVLGFDYIQDKYFIYSIPTGGELYQVFWSMVYEEPTYETAKRAMDIAGVDIVYFYLPGYWFNLEKLLPTLNKEVDEILFLEQGKAWVFKFERRFEGESRL